MLVVGCGETGLDLAYRAVTSPARAVTLVVRRGFLSVPTTGAGRGVPLDSMITNLFESTHLHPWLERTKLRWKVTTPFIRGLFWLATGSSVGFNQLAGGLPGHEVQRGHHLINKSTQALPYINRPVRQRARGLFGWLQRNVWDWADLTRGDPGFDPKFDPQTAFDNHSVESDFDNDSPRPNIDIVRSGIESVGADGCTVKFVDGTEGVFDIIVMCTGYRQRFPFLFQKQTRRATDWSGHTGNRNSNTDDQVIDFDTDTDDPLPLDRNICSDEEPGLAFLGFVRPNVGAIPPMSELQVMWWILRLKGQMPSIHSRGPPTSRLLGNHCSRVEHYSVDYGAYMHDLARDIGCVPGVLAWLSTSPRVAVGYALGQAYVSYFRLDGPFRCGTSRVVCDGELWRPVIARGVIANFVFVVVLLVFAWLTTLCWCIDISCRVLRKLVPF